MKLPHRIISIKKSILLLVITLCFSVSKIFSEVGLSPLESDKIYAVMDHANKKAGFLLDGDEKTVTFVDLSENKQGGGLRIDAPKNAVYMGTTKLISGNDRLVFLNNKISSRGGTTKQGIVVGKVTENVVLQFGRSKEITNEEKYKISCNSGNGNEVSYVLTRQSCDNGTVFEKTVSAAGFPVATASVDHKNLPVKVLIVFQSNISPLIAFYCNRKGPVIPVLLRNDVHSSKECTIKQIVGEITPQQGSELKPVRNHWKHIPPNDKIATTIKDNRLLLFRDRINGRMIFILHGDEKVSPIFNKPDIFTSSKSSKSPLTYDKKIGVISCGDRKIASKDGAEVSIEIKKQPNGPSQSVFECPDGTQIKIYKAALNRLLPEKFFRCQTGDKNNPKIIVPASNCDNEAFNFPNFATIKPEGFPGKIFVHGDSENLRFIAVCADKYVQNGKDQGATLLVVEKNSHSKDFVSDRCEFLDSRNR